MKISIQKVAFLSLLAGMLPACHESGTNQVRSDGSIPVTVLQPTTVELPRTYVADIQAIQFVEIKPKVEGYVKEVRGKRTAYVPAEFRKLCRGGERGRG